MLTAKDEAIMMLKDSLELLSDVSRWTKESFALNAKGDETFPRFDNAVKWNPRGAITKFSMDYEDNYGDQPYDIAMSALQSVVPDVLYVWEESEYTTHSDVINSFNAAIVLLSS